MLTVLHGADGFSLGVLMFSGDLFEESESMADYYMTVVTEQFHNSFAEEVTYIANTFGLDPGKYIDKLETWVEYQEDGYIL